MKFKTVNHLPCSSNSITILGLKPYPTTYHKTVLRLKKVSLMTCLMFFFSFPQLFAQQQVGADIVGETWEDHAAFASLSGDGSRIAIGAPHNNTSSGHIRVFQNTGNTWTQIGADIDGLPTYYYVGNISLDLSADGKRVAIGAPTNNTSTTSEVRVFEEIAGSWVQMGAAISEEFPMDACGGSVELSADGKRIVIGAHQNDGGGSASGQARIFEYQAGAWVQIGSDIDGESPQNWAGQVSISANGKRIALGASANSGNGYLAGHVRIFEEAGGNWTQVGADIDGIQQQDRLGRRVSLSDDGKRIALNTQSSVDIFQESGGSWTKISSFPTQFTTSISLSGDGKSLIIGQPYFASDSGRVRTYKEVGTTWTLAGTILKGSQAGDGFGMSVSISDDGSYLAAGATQNTGYFTYGNGYVSVYSFLGTTNIDDEISQESPFTLLPNPNNGHFTLDLGKGHQEAEIRIFSATGQFISQERIQNTRQKELHIDQAPGIYFVHIKTHTGLHDVIKVSKF